MRYRDLHELIQNSQSSRAFFLSLPVEIQCQLHEHNACIHSAVELRNRASALKSWLRLTSLGGWDTHP